GDLNASPVEAERRDEIGAMARAMEVFRENALEVQRLNAEREAQEIARRRQIEALLQGIEVLNGADEISEMFDGVLRTLGRLVEFEEAAILLEGRDGVFTTVATTNDAFMPEIDPPTQSEATFIDFKDADEDAQEAERDPVFDLMDDFAAEPDWPMTWPRLLESCDYRVASRIKGLGFRSGLIAPLNAHSRRALMVCARRDSGAYGGAELGAVRAFTPIAEQAVRNAEQVDELEGAVRELDSMAHHDALTGLKNRKSFINVVDSIAAEVDANGGRPFALFHIDLDHFKVINDSVGHAAGDHALTWAAGVIQRCVRTDDIVARLGGDEFAVICPEEQELDGLIRIAEKLTSALSEPFEFEGKSLQMGASIGIGRFPADSDDPTQILNIADMALLEAKAAGRGRFSFFSVSLRRELERRQTLEFKLREGIQNNEFELWYQPIVCMRTRRVHSFEALLRWRNARLGLVEPAVFVPIAERAGLMNKLGDWVVRTACAEMKDWILEQDGRRVAVNVAGGQLSSSDFVAMLDGVVAEAGLPPNAVELELSEEIALRRSAELALDNLMALYNRGYQIAFDDFGTGYSSLAHLRRFPGQRMKIDQSFIAGCDAGATDGADRALTEGLFVLAKSLNMSVVAEGVETDAQLAFLEEIGCDEVQGFYFGAPAPLAEALQRADEIDAAAEIDPPRRIAGASY
ncbi:MAG: EAL domain-containing protein, partial [Pseudomonadota bacterium]